MSWEVCTRCNQRLSSGPEGLCAACVHKDPARPLVAWELTEQDIITLRIARIDPEQTNAPKPDTTDDGA